MKNAVSGRQQYSKEVYSMIDREVVDAITFFFNMFVNEVIVRVNPPRSICRPRIDLKFFHKVGTRFSRIMLMGTEESVYKPCKVTILLNFSEFCTMFSKSPDITTLPFSMR